MNPLIGIAGTAALGYAAVTIPRNARKARAARAKKPVTIDAAAYGLVPADRLDARYAGPDPEADAVAAAALAGDWRRAAAYLAGAGRDWDLRWYRTGILVHAAAEDDTWLKAWRTEHPDDPSAALVHADALVTLAGKVRGDKKYGRSIGFRYHDGKPGIVEGLLSRGDRRVGDVIRAVYEDGGRFDGWREHFSYDRWMACADKALADHGVDVDWYTTRERTYEEVLPWDHLDSGLDKDWLWEDWQDALSRPRSRTAAGPPASIAASARRWTRPYKSARPARSCCP